jgi:hypothetical protein
MFRLYAVNYGYRRGRPAKTCRDLYRVVNPVSPTGKRQTWSMEEHNEISCWTEEKVIPLALAIRRALVTFNGRRHFRLSPFVLIVLDLVG